MLPRLGGVKQVAYVVRDIEAALDTWVNGLGVGPFFVAERFHLTDYRYRGAPSNPELTVALAQSGAIQIELIQQNDDVVSLYTEFLDAGGEGQHHIAYWTRDFDRDLAACEAHGITELQSGRSASGGANERFIYFAPVGRPGTIIELSEVMGWKADWLQRVADAAENWDGSDPIRPAPPLPGAPALS